MSNILVDLVRDVFTFDVEIHRPKKARGNEKDKVPSGVKSRPNEQQTSTPDTEPRYKETNFCLVIVAQCLVCWFAGH